MRTPIYQFITCLHVDCEFESRGSSLIDQIYMWYRTSKMQHRALLYFKVISTLLKSRKKKKHGTDFNSFFIHFPIDILLWALNSTIRLSISWSNYTWRSRNTVGIFLLSGTYPLCFFFRGARPNPCKWALTEHFFLFLQSLEQCRWLVGVV